jgi:GT2 family glycosyltransferase
MKSYFYTLLYKYLSLFIRPGSSVVEIAPHHDHLISLFKNRRCAVYMPVFPARAMPSPIARFETWEEIRSMDSDVILLNGNLHYENDIQALLERLHDLCECRTRLIITYYSGLWRPLIRLATLLQIRYRTPEQNWLTHEDVDNFLHLTGFEAVRKEFHVLCPVYFPLISDFLNRFVAPLPFFRHFSLVNILVARPLLKNARTFTPSVSVVVPARNEAGTIEELITRIPRMGPDDEIIFVEGHSTDATGDVLREAAVKYGSSKKIIVARQSGKGKGDAVRRGFELATKEIVVILDADISVAPEDLTKFYNALLDDKGEFVNGSRLVYPVDAKAMKFMNMIGNKFFAGAFSFVIGQRFKDTLCGAKALSRESYLKIARNRSYFGDFDPFGDFDLIFGASSLGMKIVELPVHYHQRRYGTTNIRRWEHGILLLRMLFFAARKMKFI